MKILTDAELESRYHVRLERYIKDMFIELHTLREIVDTMVLPAAFSYSGSLLDAAAKAKTARVTVVPQIEAANNVGKLIKELQKQRAALERVIAKAETMHEKLEEVAELLTHQASDTMADVRKACEAVRAKGGKVTREPGPVKGGTTVIAFVEDPDGYKMEFIERKRV